MNSIPPLPERPAAAHKGSFGTCLLVGGSEGMMGAVVLAARAALRTGVGLTRVLVPRSQLGVLPVAVPEATSTGLDESDGAIRETAAGEIVAASSGVAAVGIGPGMSLRGSARQLVRAVVAQIEGPLVVDADALNAMVGGLDLVRERRAPTVLTPHPGEAARLLGLESAAAVQADRRGAATRLATSTGAIVVLKGAGTVVCEPSGEVAWTNETGNAGMATGGSGDVLTGIVTSLLAQGMEPLSAACLGVHAHGLAGDHVVARGSMPGLIAGDLVEALPGVWRELGGSA